ncbi:secretin N-terminal domain-containing protein [Thioalkalivibrio sp. ALE17]|uniref:secretin N-terminal domain-containing protein n=1 Tax=Thioalkalivibrio sp. ALE17 TaxID=1158173 RepID=UPI000490DEA4|nr:secretin N-terminal domain-containing protein [Thioalkalivibrio sp. ALE17]
MKPSNSAASSSEPPDMTERRYLLRAALALAAGTLLPGLAGARDTHAEVAVLPLQHRPANSLLPELQALFGDTATLRGDGFRLLVRADARTLQQIREVVAELDTPAQDLVLSVRRHRDAPRTERGTGLEFESGPEGTEGRISSQRLRTTRRDDQTQHLRLREGTEAIILVGETRAAGFRILHGRAGVGIEPLLQETARGFRVRPQVQPDGRIRIAISQLHEGPLPRGAVDRDAIDTQLTLEPGTWHTLGGVHTETDVTERGLASRRTTRDRDTLTLEIRVDPAR